MSNQSQAFRALHTGPLPLRLVNAWDAGSARLFESLGAHAIGTTSAGMAWALGYPDGRILPAGEALGVVTRMTRVLRVPLSVDIEHGFSDDPGVVATHVKRLIDAGVAGVNIEDGSDSPSLLAAKIEAIKTATVHAGADIFVNARTDVFLGQLVTAPMQVEESITRGALYASAGADGLFVPALHRPEDIQTIASEITLPLNVLTWKGLAVADELGKLGVRRLSLGAAISQALWANAATLAEAFLEAGQSDPLMENPMPRPRLQGLFTGVGVSK
jgi:2-methylisocitrate lyase-like PEP mutase family enzyme